MFLVIQKASKEDQVTLSRQLCSQPEILLWEIAKQRMVKCPFKRCPNYTEMPTAGAGLCQECLRLRMSLDSHPRWITPSSALWLQTGLLSLIKTGKNKIYILSKKQCFL